MRSLQTITLRKQSPPQDKNSLRQDKLCVCHVVLGSPVLLTLPPPPHSAPRDISVWRALPPQQKGNVKL